MKKTNLTFSVYQSKFLPIVQRAETEIKKLIQYYALHLKSKSELRKKIEGIIRGVAKHLPFSLFDREKYILGLYKTSEKMIREFYDNVVNGFLMFMAVAGLLFIKGKKPKTPHELLAFQKTSPKVYQEVVNQIKTPMWQMAKGTPYVADYGKAVKNRIKELAKTPTVSAEPSGKKPISLWQKAELDIRHENQLNRIDELIKSGVRYAWTSTHPDCSKRCEKWQGKLFDLVAENSELSGFRMRKKLDGNTVYCFKEVTRQVDKYGYNNNIIVGFNCRHRLVEYTGQKAPRDYDKEDVAEQRKINAKLREFERKIRFYKTQAVLYNKTDPQLSNQCKRIAEKLTKQYKEFADKNGYAWYQYRIDI
jgi:hypothetical protein